MTNTKLFIASFGFFLLVMFAMLWSEQQAGCGKIIIPLELAGDINMFKAMVANCNVAWIKYNTEIDFLFLLAYSAPLFFGLRGLLGRFSGYAWLAFLPAVFDTVENILLIKFLDADVTTLGSMAFTIYYMCVRTKFMLLLVILLTLLGLGVKHLVTKRQAKV